MITNNPSNNKRVMVFIDGEYVIQSFRDIIKGNKKEDINLQSIIRHICKKCGDERLYDNIVRIYYYTAELSRKENPETYEKQKIFLKGLKDKIPNIHIKLGKMIPISKSKWIQKGVDVKLSIDMLSKAFKNHYDIAILIAGDSDFAELITEIKESYGKNVILCVFDRSCDISDELKYAPDKFIEITKKDIISKELIKK